jgi:Zn-dependent protease with chaperone function
MIGINRVKTWILISALAALFVAVGAWIGGGRGATIALVLAFVFNFIMYWSSDRIAIAATRSKPVSETEAPSSTPSSVSSPPRRRLRCLASTSVRWLSRMHSPPGGTRSTPPSR